MAERSWTGQATMLVIPWSPHIVGGVSTVVRHLRTQWLEAGNPVVVVVDTWEDRSLVLKGDEWHCRMLVMGASKGIRMFPGLVGGVVTLRRTWTLLTSKNVNAVNFHYAGLGALGVALLKRLGLFRGRLVLSFHGTDVRAAVGCFERWAWRTVFDRCDAVTVCSRSLGERLSGTMGVAKDKLHVVYNGVDLSTFNCDGTKSRDDPNRFPFKRYVVSVGSYISRKGHRVLLEAFAAVHQTVPDLGLVIAGMDGPERAWLEQRAATLGLADRVVLLCDLQPSDVASLLRQASVAVQPSLDEPFGLAVIEAAACGVPVAVSAVGGHLEIVEDGRTGWVFAAADAGACAATLSQVLSQPVEAQRREQRLRHEVSQRFTWKRCADDFRALLQPSGTADAGAISCSRAMD